MALEKTGQVPERVQLPRGHLSEAETPHWHRGEQEGREATAELLGVTLCSHMCLRQGWELMRLLALRCVLST